MRFPLARRVALEHPVRRAILEAVRADPGATAAEVAFALGADWKTVAHHARVLAAAGQLDLRREGNRRRLFPREATSAERRVRVAASAETASRVLAVALDRPGATLQEIADALGAPASTLRWHVARLREHGFLVDAGAGVAVRCGAREAVRDALRR